MMTFAFHDRLAALQHAVANGRPAEEIQVRTPDGRVGVVDDVLYTDMDTLVDVRFTDGAVEMYPTYDLTMIGA